MACALYKDEAAEDSELSYHNNFAAYMYRSPKGLGAQASEQLDSTDAFHA